MDEVDEREADTADQGRADGSGEEGSADGSGEEGSADGSGEEGGTDGAGENGSAQARTPFRLGDRPALTGIRAVGVSLVLIFHSNFRTLPGSWVALNIFFVLSGFLITSMLASEHRRTGTVKLTTFYARRAVRLLPPLALTAALIAVYASVVHVAYAAQRVWGDIAAALFYFADYRSAFGHESHGALLGFLAQCWSLAVEEQFYLIWAVLFIVALRVGRRRLAYAAAVAGIVACTVNRYRIVLDAHHWNAYVSGRAYYAFDTRADALFLGCLLGLLATGNHLQDWRPGVRRLVSVAALASTAVLGWVIATVGLGARSLPLVWLPVTEVGAAVIILYFVVRPEGWGTRAMSLPLLVLVGNMSYTIYLVHWPVYVATGVFSPTDLPWSYWPSELTRLAIIFTIAAASWYLMERPLTRWRRRTMEVGLPAAAASAAAASAAAAETDGPAPVAGGARLAPRPRVGAPAVE